MKRIIVCLAAACLFVPSLFAESKDVGITGTVQFGVGSFGTEFKKAFLQPGITISEEYGVGGGVSVFFRYVSDSRLGVQTELGYSSTARDLVATDGEYSDSASFSCKTIDFTLLACYDFAVSQLVSFTPLAGIQFGILCDDIVVDYGPEYYNDYLEVDTVLVSSLVAGACIFIGPLVIDGRFNYDLNPVTINEFKVASFTNISLSAGLHFKLQDKKQKKNLGYVYF